MGLPKQRQSKGRRNRRRSHDGIDAPGLCVCPKCDEPRQPHRVCGYCGYYGEDKVLDLKEPKAGI